MGNVQECSKTIDELLNRRIAHDLEIVRLSSELKCIEGELEDKLGWYFDVFSVDFVVDGIERKVFVGVGKGVPFPFSCVSVVGGKVFFDSVEGVDSVFSFGWSKVSTLVRFYSGCFGLRFLDY